VFAPLNRTNVLVSVLLPAATLLVFLPVVHNEFVNYDDDVYITQNRFLQDGLSLHNVRWAFTTTYYGIYHPVAWLSHMVDIQLFGMNPLGHHLHSLLIHTATALLLFHLLRRMTGRTLPSALAAALFAIHPLQVQSVVWAAERKNLLAALFWVLATWCYHRYAQRPSPARYLLTAAVYLLGLLAKASLVMFPFVLLALDWWPLRRVTIRTRPDARAAPTANRSRLLSPARAVLEKGPLFLLSFAAFAVGVYVARNSANRVALTSLADLPLANRLGNALSAYGHYVLKLFWPRTLLFSYPYPTVFWPPWTLLGHAALFGALSLLAVRRARQNPYLAAGWIFYLLALVPNCGLVDYGFQVRADRYVYIPIIGLAVMVAWSLAECRRRRPALRHALNLLLGAWLLALGIAANRQTRTWRNDLTFFGHSAARFAAGYLHSYARLGMGRFLLERGRLHEAKQQFLAADDEDAPGSKYSNLGACFFLEQDYEAAAACYRKAIREQQGLPYAYYNLGLYYHKKRDYLRAVVCYELSIKAGEERAKLGPAAPLKFFLTTDDAHNNIGAILLEHRAVENAVAHFRAALAFNPRHVSAHVNLGHALQLAGDPHAAEQQYREALRIEPDRREASRALDALLTARQRQVSRPQH